MLAINVLTISNTSTIQTSNTNLLSLFKLNQAQGSEDGDCNCGTGQVCVNGVCVTLERATRSSCTTEEWCGWWQGYVECPGHTTTCPANPDGVTNCSGVACKCDQSPC